MSPKSRGKVSPKSRGKVSPKSRGKGSGERVFSVAEEFCARLLVGKK
jgi:hypothetical protein